MSDPVSLVPVRVDTREEFSEGTSSLSSLSISARHCEERKYILLLLIFIYLFQQVPTVKGCFSGGHGHGRRSVGDGGGDASAHFSARWGPHMKCPPPLFCLKSRKYHVCSSSSNLHSFIRLRNRHMLVEIASGHVPHPVPPPIYTHGCTMNQCQ